MSEGLKIALVVAIPPLIVAVTGLIVLFRHGDKINELHLTMNSRLDQLIAVVKQESFAAGVKSETDKKK